MQQELGLLWETTWLNHEIGDGFVPFHVDLKIVRFYKSELLCSLIFII